MKFKFGTNRIQLALLQQPGVAQAIVAEWKNQQGEKTVVAYLISDGIETAVTTIREGIKLQLSAALTPSYFIWMDEFPINSSEKIDIHRLPNPEPANYIHVHLYSDSKTIIDLFIEQVEKTPDTLAAVYEDKTITYNELNNKSNQVASYLKKHAIKEGALIPICIDRSVEMVIGILGILKAGGAYVPIDPSYPQDRIDYILTDVNSDLVVSSTKSRHALTTNKKTICLDEDWPTIEKESQ